MALTQCVPHPCKKRRSGRSTEGNRVRTQGEDSVHEVVSPGGPSPACTVTPDSQPPELGEDKLLVSAPCLWPLVMATPDTGMLACGALMGLRTLLRGCEVRSGC